MFFGLAILVINFVIVAKAFSANFTIIDLIKPYNYPVEVHTIETPDGYILKMHRIPHSATSTKSKQVALLVHGMGGSAENWLFLGAPDSLSFYLSDRGYDVWMINVRGTAHSRKHRSLNPIGNSKRYWNFSWHEMATNDIPTAITYILKKTGKNKIFYVGHSQGSTILYVMLSEMPEMNQKIIVAALMCPAVLIYKTQVALLKAGAKILPFIQKMASMLNWYELIIPNSPSLNRIVEILCKPKSMVDLCIEVFSLAGGTVSGFISKTRLPLYTHFFPSGFSMKQWAHYGQIMVSGEFKQYDYGRKKNLRKYNSTKPPMYNLSNAVIPIGHYYADIDQFGSELMTLELGKVVPNVVIEYRVDHDGFNHLDFAVGQNARDWVYEPVFALFQQYEDNQ